MAGIGCAAHPEKEERGEGEHAQLLVGRLTRQTPYSREREPASGYIKRWVYLGLVGWRRNPRGIVSRRIRAIRRSALPSLTGAQIPHGDASARGVLFLRRYTLKCPEFPASRAK